MSCCFVEEVLKKRPAELKATGPLYLSVIENPKTSVWYKKTPMGKNTINNIMKTMKKNSPLRVTCPDKRLTNHSARKTVFKKLKSSGIPKSSLTKVPSKVWRTTTPEMKTSKE